MTAPGFGVKPGELDARATKVREVSAMIHEAAAAAESVGTGGVSMYGLFCSRLIMPALSVALPDTACGVKEAANLSDAIAAGLADCAGNYQAIDDEVRALMEEFL